MENTLLTCDESQTKLIHESLATGENINWVGQEPCSRYITNRILGIIVPTLIALFAGFFTILMLVMNPNIFSGSLQGLIPVLIPFAIFGMAVYSLVRGILAFIRGRPTLYVVTNRRAMLIEQGATVEIKSYGPEAIQTMQITRRKNGSGRIIFERNVSWGRDSEGRSQRRVIEIGFFGLPSVDEVCRHLNQISRPEPAISLGGAALPESPYPKTAPASEFFAVETSALHEYLFKISIISGKICGAKIAGSFSAMGLQHMGDVSGYGFLFSSFASRIAAGEKKRETCYQSIDPLSTEFLSADKANFRYSSLEINHAAISEEYITIDSGYNASGRLEIHLRDGKIRKLWLTRNANPAAVMESIRANGIRIEGRESVPVS